MEQVGAQHPFALEPNLLRDALRTTVVRVGDQLEPLESEIFECVVAEKPKGSSRHTSPSRIADAPIADVPGVRIVHAHADRSDDTPAFGDRELLPSDPGNLSEDEGSGIVLRIGPWDDGNPVLDVGVVARFDDRGHIVERPGTQLQVAVAELHLRSLERRKAAAAAFRDERKSAATYSPGRLPSEYHRRQRA